MFENIGKKIKGLAVATTCFGVITSVICGIVAFKISPVLCLVIIAAGSLVSWVGSFALYGFGHLIDVNETTAFYAKHSFNKLHNVVDDVEAIKQKLNNDI